MIAQLCIWQCLVSFALVGLQDIMALVYYAARLGLIERYVYIHA